MSKIKTKVIIIILVFIALLGCTLLLSKQSKVEAYPEYNHDRFITIEQGGLDFLDYRIVYDKKTKVEYMITNYNNKLSGITITPLYNQDGSLLTYKKGIK